MIEFGIFDHLDRRLDVDVATTYADRLRLIAAYEEAGFYSYHLAEHHATPLTMSPAPSIFLAAVAERTARLRFGPMVYVLPLYHPLRLVEEVCMLDQLSGGRLDMGLGRGITDYELSYFGVDPKEARSLFDETQEILFQGLTADSVTYSGAHYRFDDVPVPLSPVQTPHPPIWTGIGSPDGAARAGAAGHNVLTNSPVDMAAEFMAKFRESWEAVHGGSDAVRPFSGVCRHTYIAETDAEAERVMREAYATWYDHFTKLFQKLGGKPAIAQYTADFDETVARRLLVFGTPERVAEQIAETIEETGTNYFVCRFAFGSLTIGQSLAALEMFTERVMPHLTTAGAGRPAAAG